MLKSTEFIELFTGLGITNDFSDNNALVIEKLFNNTSKTGSHDFSTLKFPDSARITSIFEITTNKFSKLV